MKKLALGLALISCGAPLLFSSPRQTQSSEKDPKLLHKKIDIDTIPFSFKLTDTADLATIIEAIVAEAKISGTLKSYPPEFIECAQKIKTGKLRVGVKTLRPIMPYVLKHIAPQLIEDITQDDPDVPTMIYRAQRIQKQNCSVNSDITHPVFPSVDLSPVIRLLCEIAKKLDKCLSNEPTQNTHEALNASEILDSTTQCCQELSDAIDNVDHKITNLQSSIDNCCDNLETVLHGISSKIDSQNGTMLNAITDVKDTLTSCCESLSGNFDKVNEGHQALQEHYSDLTDTIGEASGKINLACDKIEYVHDDVIDALAEIKYSITECYEYLAEDLEQALDHIDDVSHKLDHHYNTIENLADNVDEVSGKVNTVYHKIDCCEDNVIDAIADVKDTLTDCSRYLADNLENVANRVDEINIKLDQQSNILEEHYANLADNVDETNDQVESIVNKIDSVQDNLVDVFNEIKDTLTECCESLAESLDNVGDIVDEINIKLDGKRNLIEECYENLTDDIDDVKEDIESVNQKVELAQDVVLDAVMEVQETLTACCDSLSDSLENIDENLEGVKNRLDEERDLLEEYYDDLSDNIDETSEKVDSVQDKVEFAHNSILNAVDDVRDTLTQCCESFSSTLENIDDHVEMLRGIMHDHGEEMQETLDANYEQSQDALNQCCDELQDAIDDCCTELKDTITQCCEFLADRIDSLSGGTPTSRIYRSSDSNTINELPFVIDTPGNYSLSETLTINGGNGVIITADNVVLDLSSKSILGNNADFGIVIDGGQDGINNVVIQNGTISAMNADGITAHNVQNLKINNITVTESINGFNLINCQNAIIDDCVASSCSSNGFLLQGEVNPTVRTIDEKWSGCVQSLNRHNCVQHCKALSIHSNDGNAFGFRSLGGLNNIFTDCSAKDIHTDDAVNASQAVGFSLGSTINNKGLPHCTECGSKIIECEVYDSSVMQELDPSKPGGGHSIGILLESNVSADGLEDRDVKQHGLDAHSLSWSSDGCLLATGGAGTTTANEDGEIIIWRVDKTTGRLSFNAQNNHGLNVKALAFNPHEPLLASGSDGSSAQDSGDEICIWRVDKSTGELIQMDEKDHGNSVLTLSWSPDGCFLVSGSTNGTIRTWELDKKKGVLTFLEQIALGGDITRLAWSPDGCYLAVASSTPVPEISFLRFDKPNKTLSITHELIGLQPSVVNDVTFSPDGSFVATAEVIDADGLVRIYKFDKTNGIAFFNHEQLLNNNITHNVAWSPDGSFLISGSNNLDLWQWNKSNGNLVHCTHVPTAVTIHDSKFSSDGRFLATGLSNGEILIKTSGIIYPQELTIKNNNISRIFGGCGGFGIINGNNNLVVNNQTSHADFAYTGVTNIFSSDDAGLPGAFDNIAFSPVCTGNTFNLCDEIKSTCNQCCDTIQGNIETCYEEIQGALDTCCTDVKETLTQCCDDLAQRIDTCCEFLAERINTTTGPTAHNFIIQQFPFTITLPGVYTVATNAQASSSNSITIASNDVVLDLASHTLHGTITRAPGCGAINGIMASGVTNITIQNGSIADMPGCGISLENCCNVVINNINVLNNTIGIEVRGTNLLVDPSTVTALSTGIKMSECRAYKNRFIGFLLTGVKDAVLAKLAAIENGLVADPVRKGGVVLESCADLVINKVLSSSNAVGYLFSLSHNAAVNNSVALLNQDNGFTIQGETINNVCVPAKQIMLNSCKSISNHARGIHITKSCADSIFECECKGNSQEGINLESTTEYTCVRGNTLTSNGSYGIYDHRAIIAIDLAALGIIGPLIGEVLNLLGLESANPTTNRVFGNHANNNAGFTNIGDLLRFQLGLSLVTIELGDKNFRNVPALLSLLPGLVPLSLVTAGLAGSLANVSS